MATGDGGERTSLGCYVKKQTKYGSVSNNINRREKYIVHTVHPDDTLQGIALKYGVTMEQIKRANKLWSADCLFLRPTLNIPVAADLANFSLKSGTDVSNSEINGKNKETHCTDSGDFNLNDTISTREESLADFLIRIDSSIAETKDKVKYLQQITVHSDDDLNVSRQKIQKYKHRHLHSTGSLNITGSSSQDFTDDISIPPQPVVMTGGHKVRSSLRKLEKQQDEIFEL
ncbi:lysM and putative peptidoglycan-binding domain-containing protein 2 isoform X1 [Centruroides vittatus]|uniref:lysM and putative peptidoglycan-binding domain-containing protein 2-like isoform X1 n=2 Tax=Centruroides TaxID=6875 RepID=UPI000C6E0244|nr:lysM and putative peptidoglycan-binding domain-containing protein 2-like isoform X1 [Centruroides sculpturatus]